MPKVRFFKSTTDSSGIENSLENKINSFLQGKQLISIQQSVTAIPPNLPSDPQKFLMIVTVVYDDGKK